MIAVAFAVGIVMDLFWVLAMGPLGQNSKGDWDGLGTQKNSLGNHGLLAVMVFIIAARTFRRFRTPFYFLTLISIVLLVGSQSKTSLGAGLITAASFVVFVVYRARKTLVGAVTIALVTGAAITVAFVTANLEEVTGRFGKDPSFTGRTDLWVEVIRAIERKPWLGFGFDGYFGDALSESHLITAFPASTGAPTTPTTPCSSRPPRRHPDDDRLPGLQPAGPAAGHRAHPLGPGPDRPVPPRLPHDDGHHVDHRVRDLQPALRRDPVRAGHRHGQGRGRRRQAGRVLRLDEERQQAWTTVDLRVDEVDPDGDQNLPSLTAR